MLFHAAAVPVLTGRHKAIDTRTVWPVRVKKTKFRVKLCLPGDALCGRTPGFHNHQSSRASRSVAVRFHRKEAHVGKCNEPSARQSPICLNNQIVPKCHMVSCALN